VVKQKSACFASVKPWVQPPIPTPQKNKITQSHQQMQKMFDSTMRATIPAPVCFSYFSDRVSHFCPGYHQTTILLPTSPMQLDYRIKPPHLPCLLRWVSHFLPRLALNHDTLISASQVVETTSMNHFTSFIFILRQGLTKLLRLASNLWSSNLSLLRSWNYRHVQPCSHNISLLFFQCQWDV
jgi:hypothetical protein